jgi:hypothetical protein
VSDGTGEAAVVKLDPTSAGDMGVTIAGNTLYPGTHLKIWEIEYNVTGMTLQVRWAATSPQDLWLLQGFGHHRFKKDGGLYVPQSGGAPVTGATGKVTFTTMGAAGGSTYAVTIWAKKDIAQ